MKKPIKISIPQPCHEKWAEMTSTDKGRFCASCQKNVIDFTRAPDRVIANTLKADKNLCGRFLPSQLERDLIIAKEKSSLWAAAGAAVLAFLTIGNNEVSAQTPVNTEQTDNKTDSTQNINSKETIIITGIVSDEVGSLPGASIFIKGTLTSTQTDIEGNYTIKAKEGDTLVFSYVGYNTLETIINNNNKICVVLQNDPSRLMTGIFVTDYHFKKRTFFGRIFHFIGNLFR